MTLALAGPADTALSIVLFAIVLVLWLVFRPRLEPPRRHVDEPLSHVHRLPRLRDWQRDDPDLSA